MMNELTINAYLDGRPGHEKQTMAVIQALQQLTPITVSIQTSTSTINSMLTMMPAALLLKLNRRRATAGLAEKLLIGSGRRTHPAIVRDKHRLGNRAAAVCCMRPDISLRHAFDLCLLLASDRVADADNIFRTTGPPCLSVDEEKHDHHRGLILIGGLDPKSHRWDTDLICQQVATLIKQGRERIWTISSSPRTPPETVIRLAHLTATVPNRATFYRAEDTAGSWIEKQYQQNGEVWVTADSISMVYEALSAGCRVGVLPVQWRRPGRSLHQRSLDQLERQNRIGRFDHWLAGTPLPTVATVLNEAERCAREILRRWWPERL